MGAPAAAEGGSVFLGKRAERSDRAFPIHGAATKISCFDDN
jgi:hypothetical protein